MAADMALLIFSKADESECFLVKRGSGNLLADVLSSFVPPSSVPSAVLTADSHNLC